MNDELQAIIWEPQHMDKLIPSMLFNMQDSEDLDRYCTHTYEYIHTNTNTHRVQFSVFCHFSLNLELEQKDALRQIFIISEYKLSGLHYIKRCF